MKSSSLTSLDQIRTPLRNAVCSEKRLILVGCCILAFLPHDASAAQPLLEPVLLFMHPGDAHEPRGQLRYQANALDNLGRIRLAEPNAGDSSPEPRTHAAARGLHFRPLLAVPQPEGDCQVFGSISEETSEEPRTFRWRLYAAHTPDGYHCTAPREVYRNPPGPWLIEASMTRQGITGELFFYIWSRSRKPEQGHALWGFASLDGEQWRPIADQPVYLDHDAFGMMWDARTARFITGQVTYQAWPKPFPDNLGPSTRRVLSMRTSRDGLTWETVGGSAGDSRIVPDDSDSDDVEFYRMQPFTYGDRYMAFADLYAASPRMPNQHGPHLTCEWWVSADGIDWQRPWRDVDAQGDAPYPVKMAPMWFGREMLFWVSGQVYGLPEYRIASIGAGSNAEFSSASFTMPDRPLLLNASIPRGHGLFRQAYVEVEVRNVANEVIAGYERDKCVLQDVDHTRIPLCWGENTGTALAGKTVSLRFFLRSARLYALATERG